MSWPRSFKILLDFYFDSGFQEIGLWSQLLQSSTSIWNSVGTGQNVQNSQNWTYQETSLKHKKSPEIHNHNEIPRNGNIELKWA